MLPSLHRPAIVCALLLLVPVPGAAAEALLAVAANFTPVAVTLKGRFESHSAHTIAIASGSTGKLYAQIVNGAPYDAFLAADRRRPALLEEQGIGVPGSRFTYAIGRLGIWIPGSEEPQHNPERLGSLRRVAIANPQLAPYGAAAEQVIARLGLAGTLQGRIAVGENVAQAYAMVASGAADGGLVAWSHLLAGGKVGEAWRVPAAWHEPIAQDALLLDNGAGNAAARDFLAYLQTEDALAVIRAAGYPTD
ncbi:MAG: molybdate ABC transporter substrate-binding protein [Pseudomonadales bacterium]